jgi:hypothetical protein
LRIVESTGGGAAQELSRIEFGSVRQIIRHHDVLYVALEAGGGWIVDASDPRRPLQVGRLAEGQLIGRLLLSGDVLYVLEIKQEATAFDLADPRHPRPLAGWVAPPAPSEQPEPLPAPAPEKTAPPTAEGHVVRLAEGRAVFDFGTDQGVVRGSRVAVRSQRLVSKPDLAGAGEQLVASGEITAVLQVEEAEPARSMARLGRGDVVEVGDLVSPTDAPLSESIFVPRRTPFAGRAGFHVRPYLGLQSGRKTGGALVDLVGSYYWSSVPARIELAVAPAGVAFGGRGDHYPITVALTGAYTTDFFEIGLGAGGLIGKRTRDCFEERLSPTDPDSAVHSVCQPGEENTGFTFNQTLRLGALDGLSFTWQSSVFSRPDEFVFGMGRGEVNVPLSRRFGLFGAGGGGENGWAFGEFGVRTYVNGVGAQGTVIISASLGVVDIRDGRSDDGVVGPAVAYGMEWRL